MTDDSNRRAEHRRRMAELLARTEADGARSRSTRAARDEDLRSRATPWGSALGVLILLVLAAVFYLGSRTANQFTVADFDDASRRGTATVERCERRGPISGQGFGYYQVCAVDIDYEDGAGPRVVIDKARFMRGEKPGDTFEIGQNSGTRGSVGYSRPELGPQAWATALTIIFGALALLCVGAIYIFLREKIRDLRRRRRS